ncbi:MAG: hypothetical protein HYR60_30670 [Acidobacteria bacterium]|nr:hypothetical protein [Acidobacteriota bacterium]
MDNENNNDGSTEFDYLSYQELGQFLQPLKDQAEVCIILDVCFSGGAIAHMQNINLTGAIVTGADTSGYTVELNLPLIGGGYFTSALISCWKDLLGQRPGQPAGLDEVTRWVTANGGASANNGHPQFATIDAKGGVFPLNTAIIEKVDDPKSNPVTVRIDRPAGANGGLVVKLTISDPTVANFGGETTVVKALPAGVNSTTIQITGLRDGVTTYTAETQDSNNKPYKGLGTVRVGDGYFVQPNPIRIKAGDKVSATLFRMFGVANVTGPVKCTFIPKDPTQTGIAGVTPDVTFNTGETQKTFTVEGLRPGTVIIKVTDNLAFPLGTTFQVIVEGTPQTGCLFQGTADSTFVVSFDPPPMHDPFIGIRRAVLQYNSTAQGAVTISSDQPQVVRATGTLNQTTCVFNASGTGTVAGFQNVSCQYRNVKVDRATNRIQGDYALGVSRELPSGHEIVYSFTGTFRAGTTASAPARPLAGPSLPAPR